MAREKTGSKSALNLATILTAVPSAKNKPWRFVSTVEDHRTFRSFNPSSTLSQTIFLHKKE
jgi:hypothetical protein